MFLTPEPDALIDILPIMINMGYGRDAYPAISTCKTLWEDKYIWQVVKDMRFGALVQTPLMWHAFNGPSKHEILKGLLSRKASLIAKDDDGSTPLFYAANGNQPETVKFLHSLGADMNEPDHEGATPLIDSAYLGNTESVKALLELGANTLGWEKKHGCSAFLSSARGYGIPGDQEGCMKLLLEHGADVNEQGLFGKTALMYLAAHSWSAPDLEYLIKAGADLDLTDFENETALHRAVHANNVSCTLTLLAAAANPNVPCSIGMTPLHWAAINGHELIVEALLSAGADPLAQTNAGNTPMDLVFEEMEESQIEREEILEYRRIARLLYENGDEDADLPEDPLEALWLAEMDIIEPEEDPMWLLRSARLDRMEPLEYGWPCHSLKTNSKGNLENIIAWIYSIGGIGNMIEVDLRHPHPAAH